MTREEAIKLLSQMFLIQFTAEEHNALGMAIDALNCSKIPNSSDLISRQVAIEEAKRLHDVAWANLKETKISASTMIDALKNLPSAEPKTGHWIKDDLGTTICSECGRPRRDNRINHIKFCNSCGAKMLGEGDEA